MTPEQELQYQIQQEAETLKESLSERFGTPLDYSPVCLLYIDSFIENSLGDMPPENAEIFVQAFGSYFGECLRKSFGGVWQLNEQGERMLTEIGGSETIAHPYSTIRARIIDGEKGKAYATARAITGMVYDWIAKQCGY